LSAIDSGETGQARAVARSIVELSRSRDDNRRAAEETPIYLLFVCTAGRCRSPMAAALLEKRLGEVGSRVSVSSGGLRFTGERMPPVGVSLMARHGVDLSGHIGVQVTEHSVAEADIVLGMTREHVREVVGILPEAWPKTFTLKDFVRRAERAGPRYRHQRIADWLESVGAERQPYEALGADSKDDVADPFRRRAWVWRRVVREMDGLVTRMVPTLGLIGPGTRAPAHIHVRWEKQGHQRIVSLAKRSQLEWATSDAGGGAELR
jgi:protein-tyrosine phosphatase